MKNLRNYILAGMIGAGSLVLGGCWKSELEKHNLENKQIYQDFVSFLKENKDKDGFYFNKDHTKYANLDKERVDNFFEKFYDRGFNGMESTDLYLETRENHARKLEDLPLEKQLYVAKEYTNTLKEILHEEKYKNY